MKINYFLFFILLASGVLQSCAQIPAAGNSVENVNPIVGTWTMSIKPLDLQSDVDPSTKISMTMSAPIDPGALLNDPFRFQVLDDNYQLVPGYFTFSNNNQTITFNRTLAGYDAPLDPDTTYFVQTYIAEASGTQSWEFRTKETLASSTGKFKVMATYPDWPFKTFPVMFPNTQITVEFSEPIYPNQPTCGSAQQQALWQNVLQVINVDPADQGNRFTIGGMAGQICLTCLYAGFCNRLTFIPYQAYQDNSFAFIEVWRPKLGNGNPDPAFRGISGETLSTSHFEDYKFILFNYWGGT
ncbi:MAG: hypothetical protein J0L93_01640 [Deltaproteobacteria bacterium]|nr:hypothetical protein [Deltaproteobacteria bacterium]